MNFRWRESHGKVYTIRQHYNSSWQSETYLRVIRYEQLTAYGYLPKTAFYRLSKPHNQTCLKEEGCCILQIFISALGNTFVINVP